MTSAVDICSQSLLLMVPELDQCLTDNAPKLNFNLQTVIFCAFMNLLMRAHLWDSCVKQSH